MDEDGAQRPYDVGDHVRLDGMRYRRWWQFWKPREWVETSTYVCVWSGRPELYVDRFERQP